MRNKSQLSSFKLSILTVNLIEFAAISFVADDQVTCVIYENTNSI